MCERKQKGNTLKTTILSFNLKSIKNIPHNENSTAVRHFFFKNKFRRTMGLLFNLNTVDLI